MPFSFLSLLFGEQFSSAARKGGPKGKGKAPLPAPVSVLHELRVHHITHTLLAHRSMCTCACNVREGLAWGLGLCSRLCALELPIYAIHLGCRNAYERCIAAT